MFDQSIEQVCGYVQDYDHKVMFQTKYVILVPFYRKPSLNTQKFGALSRLKLTEFLMQNNEGVCLKAGLHQHEKELTEHCEFLIDLIEVNETEHLGGVWFIIVLKNKFKKLSE